eukprot:766216-Hanusia_phi.AAC.3
MGGCSIRSLGGRGDRPYSPGHDKCVDVDEERFMSLLASSRHILDEMDELAEMFDYKNDKIKHDLITSLLIKNLLLSLSLPRRRRAEETEQRR